MFNNIIFYLKNSAKRFPDKVAFRDGEKEITFSELDRNARLLASNINYRLNGLVKQPIGIYLPKGVDAVIAFMATIYSGNFYTPIDPTMPRLRLEKLLGILNPAMIITNNKYKNDLLSESILIDEIKPEGMDDNLLDSIANEVIDTDILYVMFTSGSTGDPKGVIISHRAVIDYIDWLTDVFEFNESTIFGNQAPFSFDNSVLDLYSTIKNGCETVIIPEEMFLSSRRLCTFINENKINTIFWVPSAMILVANSHILEKVSMNQLTKIMFAGEVMPTKQLNVWRRFVPNALYANLYGPTEIAVDCTYYIVDREFGDEESLPIGAACKNTDVLVLNEKDELVSEGEIGELCVRGSCLAHGYYGNPQKTKEVFVQNPLNHKYPERIYRTGDLVKYNEYKEIIYIGRKDTQIKHRGYRIELGEIETAVSSALEIEQCCAIYDNANKQIVIFVTPENINKNALYAHIKSMLPNYMLPGLIVSRASMPLNLNGKIDRLALTYSLKEIL
ncbi:amino acid adenylation domain-containing protein [Lacrimispora sp. 38-1]|uniref:amino acid adenylation domain-containing protein n=1 Tax=Lacrimispora sp. 38-1 TaxID=3125778 RepID=UPI003CEDD388